MPGWTKMAINHFQPDDSPSHLLNLDVFVRGGEWMTDMETHMHMCSTATIPRVPRSKETVRTWRKVKELTVYINTDFHICFIPFKQRPHMLSNSVTLGSDMRWCVKHWAHFSGCQILSPLMNPGAWSLGGLAHTPATGRWLMTGGVVFSFALISTDQPTWQPRSPGLHLNWALHHPVPQPLADVTTWTVYPVLCFETVENPKAKAKNTCATINHCTFGRLWCITPTQTQNKNDSTL